MQCFALSLDKPTKTVSLEVKIDDGSENPVKVEFQICTEKVTTSGTIPVGQITSLSQKYKTGPGPCVVTGTATNALGATCKKERQFPEV